MRLPEAGPSASQPCWLLRCIGCQVQHGAQHLIACCCSIVLQLDRNGSWLLTSGNLESAPEEMRFNSASYVPEA